MFERPGGTSAWVAIASASLDNARDGPEPSDSRRVEGPPPRSRQGRRLSAALEKTFTRRGWPGDGDTMHGWVPILIMIGLGAGFGIVNVMVPRFLGPRKPTPEKLAPYECGMPPVGDARERHPVKFYLVAMIFLLFDIEVAFLYPFAMALRELRWFGFVQLVVR